MSAANEAKDREIGLLQEKTEGPGYDEFSVGEVFVRFPSVVFGSITKPSHFEHHRGASLAIESIKNSPPLCPVDLSVLDKRGVHVGF